MLGPLRHTIAKEFLTLLRDPTARQAMLGMPIIQLLVFSFAATMDVNNVNIAVVNEDSGRWSHEYVQRVESASFVDRVIHLPSTKAVQRLIEKREVMLAIHFQPDFSRQILAGQPGKVQLLFDGRRANSGQITFSYLQRIANDLQMELTANGSAIVHPPEAMLRNWFNPNLEYRWFIVPALVATLAFIPALLMSTLGIARDRELGTLDQLVVAPISTLEIVLGKTLPAVFAGLMSGFIVFLLAVFAYQVQFNGNIFFLFLSMLVFVFSITGIGLSISALCNTQQQAMMGMFALTSPLFLSSGFISPVENMPEFLQYFSQLNPLTYFLEIVLGSFLKVLSAAEIWGNLWPMLLIGVVTVGAAAAIIRWRIQ
jgi:ABC-2 type transport system permease protein